MKNGKKKYIINENENKNVLYDVTNYKPNINDNSVYILDKYTNILIDFYNLFKEKIKTKQKEFFIFLFERGLDTIIHVFLTILFYTKNVELTYYHSQKAYYFYIEFIEQISNDNVSFLQLSSRDAVLFVYKKTIYEINNDYKKKIGRAHV